MEDITYEINYESARLCRQACDEVEAKDGIPRFAAGAFGPTNRTASISPSVEDASVRNVTFMELVDAYYSQAEALDKGGVDIFMVETIFDTLNAKAALYAIDKYQEDESLVMSGDVQSKNSSPRSVLNAFSSKTGSQIKDTIDSSDLSVHQWCRLKSMDSIQLYHSMASFGLELYNPALLIDHGMKSIAQSTTQRQKLRSHLDDKSSPKYFRFRKKKLNLVDKAIEIHEHALASIEVSRRNNGLKFLLFLFLTHSLF